ncbi:aspartate/glutamate racemase family protein [Swaminathania salitolerans]|uniref:Asp/Glu/hydantoin racemase n=1 Tax=Swaminathania salitolerans TaxID=182838 RepID=A0A511BRL3_9PROT|nr:aspartate/glutamate racemase family protein [Swaminathania salitolerans]GBQ14072.1 hydantoin racemase [Swaminathania salitolerans LMG 21291]GEL02905.1 Asp/Glu/hydantoin racemase [Swaminathania salitolerans]
MTRILVFNPNTNDSITEELVRSACAALPGAHIDGLTAPSGARYIACAETLNRAAEVTVTTLTAERVRHYDRIVLACFGDPGLMSLRRRIATPVTAMAESSMAFCLTHGERFAIVTGGQAWSPLIRDLADGSGYEKSLVDIRTIDRFGEEARTNREETLRALETAVRDIAERHGPIPVLLGGTGLAPFHSSLAERVDVPVFCSWQSTLHAVSIASDCKQ